MLKGEALRRPPLVCDNETNAQRLWGLPGTSMFPKDGINDHLVTGAPTVNPARLGTKGALHYRLTLRAGESRTIRLRLVQADDEPAAASTSAATGRRSCATGCARPTSTSPS